MSNDKVINTRVSKKIFEKISSKAKRNRITVSNFIRNIVEDTLEIHEEFHDAVDKKIRKFLSDEEKQDILGYQEIVLAKDSSCDNCHMLLKATNPAFIAFFSDSDSKIVLCLACKTKNSKPDKSAPHESTSDN